MQGAGIEKPEFLGNRHVKLNDVFVCLIKPLRQTKTSVKKDAAAIAETKRELKRKVSRKQEKEAAADTIELNEYVVLAASLDCINEQIQELYRAGWQAEQVIPAEISFRLR